MVKIEAGKYYRNRSGKRVGPMLPYEYGFGREFIVVEGDACLWSDSGVYLMAGRPDASGDLISEWTEAPKFKVGDRVRVKPESISDNAVWAHDTEFMITEVDRDGDIWYAQPSTRRIRCANPAYFEIIPTTSFTLDWPHGHVTRDGRKARIVCTDAFGAYPIVALIPCNGNEIATHHKVTGAEKSGCDGLDLLNAPAPKREWWVNVYANGDAFAHETKEQADKMRVSYEQMFACVHVTEGDGL